MLVQALAQYADTDLADQLAEQAFEEKPVPYFVELDESGQFLGVTERIVRETKGEGKKAKIVSRTETLLVPRSPVNRQAGVNPLLACDAVQYVLGPAVEAWSKKSEVEKHQRHHEGFMDSIRKAAADSHDEALRSCARFYDCPDAVAKARHALAERKPAGGANVALSVRSSDPGAEDPGGPVITREKVRDYWRKHYWVKFAERHKKGGEGICLISGKHGPIAVTHEKIKGVTSLGGQFSGVSLMSFDKPAFRSYGWEKNANSPVCPERAMAYVLALNDLLRFGRHRKGWSRDRLIFTRRDYGGVAFVYWTREANCDWFDYLDPPEMQEGAPTLDPEGVADMLGAVYTGDERRLESIGDMPFHMVVLSGNGGRLVVRDWHSGTLERVREHLRDWREGLRIADVFNGGELSTMPRLYDLLRAVSAPRVEPSDKVNAERSMQMVRRAFFSQPMGGAILAAALARARRAAGSDRLSPVRNGLIRLCTNDILRTEKKGIPLMEELDEKLDPNLNHPAYLCGQLFAVYEGLQYTASKPGQSKGGASDGKSGLNATITDRYFSLASTFPQVAFPKLETLSKAHLRKLRRENARAMGAIGKRITALTERIGAKGYPGQLSLEDQGRFIVGYHHQKAEDARRASEAKAAKETRLAKASDDEDDYEG